MTRSELLDLAHENGITIVGATKPQQANLIAIHLLEPDFIEIEQAIYDAVKDNFERVVIHTKLTWPTA